MGVLPEGLSERLQAMARFRNLLVHLYWKVDNREVHRILRENLDDLRTISPFVSLCPFWFHALRSCS